MVLALCRCCRHRVSEQLEQIMGCGQHRPFAPDLAYAAQEKPPESTRLLDLTENGLDNGFAPGVERTARIAFELSRHPATRTVVIGCDTRRLTVTGPPR